MRLNLNKNFKDFHGNETCEVIADKVAEALFMYGGRENVSPDEKYKAYKLSRWIQDVQDGINITTEEATLIKKVCASFLVAGAYGQVVDCIEG